MTRTDQAKLIVHRHVAGINDKETATEQIVVLLASDWRGVGPETVIFDLALDLLRAEARAAAAERRQRAGT